MNRKLFPSILLPAVLSLGLSARVVVRHGFRDTLDEIGDRYHDAQDAFEDCGQDIVSIDLRSELRSLRIAKRVNGCD